MEEQKYTEAEKAKIQQNEQEERLFRRNLHSLLNGDKKLASRPLVIGKTPNIFAVCNKNVSTNNDLVIAKKVIEKCMRPEMRDENGKRLKKSGHYLSEEQLAKVLENLKEPLMVLKGSLDNTFVAVTDFKDKKDKEIIVSIEYNQVGSVGNVNGVTSAYGRDDFAQYIKDNLEANNVIAINMEKADKMLLSIGVDFPEAITFISFNNSIAYTTANVKYPEEITKEHESMGNPNRTSKKNRFNDFQQRDYDFEALEKELLAVDSGQTAKEINESFREPALALMEKYGFEEAYVPGFSDDGFNFIQPIGGSKEDQRGFDGWEAIKDYFEEVDKLVEDYTQEQLQDCLNGDNSVIEYGIATDDQLQLAINAHRLDREKGEEKAELPFPDVETKLSAGESLKPKDELLQKLKDGIKQTLDSERFADWCKKQGRLYYNNYSLNNAMLTYLQKPDASYVCGYEAWKSYGRQVKQGAVGIKVLAPAFAKDYSGKGSLFAALKKNCAEQLKKDSTKEFAVYRLGQSNLTFNMYKNGLFDVKINDKAVMSHITPEETRKFIDQSVIGKVPMYYNAVTVFDISDTTDQVEFLWVAKDSCRKSEMVLDEKGEAITNKRGQVKIQNSEERKAKFSAKLNTVLDEKNTEKMQILYDVLQKINRDKGIPVEESRKTVDDTLAGGARGYFRHSTPEYPNGNIVIDEELSLTNKVAVAFHETTHADLHGDLSKLQEELGSDVEITRQMKEVQAESVAYMTASVFGIETAHKSFDYIANWSDGRDLKALESSMNVIYKESQKLLAQIEKELGARGLTMELEPKDLTPFKEEEKVKIVCEYKEFALNNLRSNEELQKAAIAELKQMDNEEISVILKEQIALTKQIEEKLNALGQKAEALENSTERSEQLKLEQQLKCEQSQIIMLQHKIDDLSTERVSLVAEQTRQGKADMKTLFMTDPLKAIEQLKQEVSKLNGLSENDMKYLATSRVISREYSRFLGSDNEKFADLALKQLANMKEVMSKHNTAVEVEFCEQWSDKPIFEKGTVAHPRAANKIITDAEKESRALKEQAAAQGDYYPYTKCSLTVYSVTKGNHLSALHTRIDIGDGGQKSLTDHLSQICNKNNTMQEILENFKNSVKERSEAKVLTPQREAVETQNIDVPKPTQTENDKPKEQAQEKHQGMEKWKGMIEGNDSRKDASRDELQRETEGLYNA